MPSHPISSTKLADIGIVMPCYNLGKYIEDALESLRKQTFQNFVAIIADDASTDPKTHEILKSLNLPDNISIVFEKKNLGLSGIRNKYMRKFNTKYVFSFDPDDILLPDFLEKCVDYMEVHPEKAAVATWLDRFGFESGISKLNEEAATLPAMLITNNYLGSCVLRKEVFLSVGGYDTAKVIYGAEDYDFWLSVLEKGWSLGVIQEALFRYRRLPDSSSSQSAKPEKAVKWRRYLVEKHENLYKKYLVDVITGFEKRASEAHVGYTQTAEQLSLISNDYEILHTYVEEDLLPHLHKYEDVAHKLRYINPKSYLRRFNKHSK